MQLINVIGAAVLLSSSSVLAAPQKQSGERMLHKRGGFGDGHPGWPWHGRHHSSSTSTGTAPYTSPFSSVKPKGHHHPSGHVSGGTGLPYFPTNSTGAPYSPTGTGSPVYSNSTTSTFPTSTEASCTVPVSTVYVTISTTSTTYVSPYGQNSTTFVGTGTGAPTSASTTGIWSNSTTSFSQNQTSTLLPASANSTTSGYFNTTTSPCTEVEASTTPYLNSTTSTAYVNTTTTSPFSSILPANQTSTTSPEPPCTDTDTGSATPSSGTSLTYAASNTTTWSSPTATVKATGKTKTKTRTHTVTRHRSASSSPTFIPASDCSNIPGVSTTSSFVQYPTTTISATTVISGTSAPSGTPIPKALLCGVHGYPVGDFFLGQYVESAAGVDITLSACYEFCATQYNQYCKSIDFYPEPGTGAPRCDLYSGSVSQSIDSIIPSVPNTWYDIGCTIPDDSS